MATKESPITLNYDQQKWAYQALKTKKETQAKIVEVGAGFKVRYASAVSQFGVIGFAGDYKNFLCYLANYLGPRTSPFMIFPNNLESPLLTAAARLIIASGGLDKGFEEVAPQDRWFAPVDRAGHKLAEALLRTNDPRIHCLMDMFNPEEGDLGTIKSFRRPKYNQGYGRGLTFIFGILPHETNANRAADYASRFGYAHFNCTSLIDLSASPRGFIRELEGTGIQATNVFSMGELLEYYTHPEVNLISGKFKDTPQAVKAACYKFLGNIAFNLKEPFEYVP